MKILSDHEVFNASLEVGYIGGGYFNPVEEFIAVSRPLTSEKLKNLLFDSEMNLEAHGEPTFFISNIYSELLTLISPREFLFGLYDNGKYKVAILVRSKERLMDFEFQVLSGRILRCGFYGVDENAAKLGLRRVFTPPKLI